VAGRIRDEDIATVRERARIDDIIREYVTLKPAGGGSLKGLCPFHDERTPSFHVTPSRGMWYCFGCAEGGDLIAFLQKIDHLTFSEAVERLAERSGVTLTYVEGGAAPQRQQGQRTRLVAAHRAAAEFYAQALLDPAGQLARTFLDQRGFDDAARAQFTVGFAPKSWDALTTHLRNLGFTDTELLTAGLLSQGARGVYDRFRGRLVWPIHDLSGDVVGFGARRLFEDDDGPKYLNTPETPIYRKSQVLYGIDLARRAIAKQQQVVIVEGYTDVMACHLAGVGTAVATCGTSFGTEHVKVIRRLLMDDDQVRGEIVYTFDGDEAGQRAALRAFGEDQRFVARTFVAVEQSGLDPCDLRLAQGDAAVRALIERRVPLFEFAIRSTLAGFDLNTAEGRIAALQQAAPVVARIKDTALRPEYARLLAGWLGLDLNTVTKAVSAGRAQSSTGSAATTRATAVSTADPTHRIEREALKCALQQPVAVAEWYASLEEASFTHPQALRVHHAIVNAGGPRADLDGLAWIDEVLQAAADDEVRGLVRELAVDPLPAESGTDSRYATSMIARLLELDASRRIDELRGQLQRCDATEHPGEHQQLFTDLLALEDYRRSLRAEATGSTVP
jgi:DNA primase